MTPGCFLPSWLPSILLILLFPGCSDQWAFPDQALNSIHINIGDSLANAELWDGKKVKTRTKFTYYWFASGRIIKSQGAVEGKVLHGDYTLTDSDHRLIEKGFYSKGLRKGKWKRWHPNGLVALRIPYRNSNISGKVKAYNHDGKLIRITNYKRGKRQGIQRILNHRGKLEKRRKYCKDKLTKETIIHAG